MKLIACAMNLLIIFAPVHAWGLKETEAEKAVRIEKAKTAVTTHEQKMRAIKHVKTNFRLESSYRALKEARKALACFAVAYPALVGLLYAFDKDLSKPYIGWIPCSLLAAFGAWGVENILREQVELYREQYEQLEAQEQ